MVHLNNQIVGLIRFSYLAEDGGWEIKVSSEEHKRQLFSQDRMSLRFEMFEKFTLPSIRYQTDKNFKCIVLCSTEMPEVYQERLLDLLDGDENLNLVALPPMPHHNAVSTVLNFAKDESYDYFTSFRFDDDDMLQRTYIENLKDKLERTKAIISRNDPLITAFNFGLFLEKNRNGNLIYDVIERTPIGIGVSMTTGLDDKRNIFSRNHRKLPSFFKTVSYIDGPVWLRTVHSYNDSNPHITGRKQIIEQNKIEWLLEQHFQLSWDELSRFDL